MSTYIKDWPCCGSVTETEGYEPDCCPFCGPLEPVYVVYCNTGKGTCGAIKQGVNKIFREEKDAINYVYDKLRDNKCYRATDDEALEELASTFVHKIDIDEAY